MKVAIIGGGLAGIVCATQLQRLGIIPDVFERNSDVAEPYRHTGAMLEIISRPVKDPFLYINHNYNIDFKPSGLVKRVIHISPTACATITGNLGYFMNRGASPDSIDNQVARNLRCNIYFNKEVDFWELKNDYDFVVVASGSPYEAERLGIWQQASKMAIKGTVVTGHFKTDTFVVWLNKDYCKSGYAYLSPFNDKEATLALAVSGIDINEIDRYWEQFVKTENITYKVKESFKRIHHSGFMYPHKVNNIYFIGNAGGALDSFLGFGVFPTVVTASEAAKSIVYNTNYDAAIKDIIRLNRKLLEFRKAFNMLDNKHYDLLIKSLKLPGVNSLIYRTKINAVNLGYNILKPFNTVMRNPMSHS